MGFLHVETFHPVPAAQSVHSEVPAAPQLHGLTERGLPWVSEVSQPPYQAKNGPAPVPVVFCWGGTDPAARGLVILCALSVVGIRPGTERNTKDGRGERKKRERKNGTWRPSLKEGAETGSLQRLHMRS